MNGLEYERSRALFIAQNLSSIASKLIFAAMTEKENADKLRSFINEEMQRVNDDQEAENNEWIL